MATKNIGSPQIGSICGDQIALVYKLRRDIEKFFAWWKRHLRVYHLITYLIPAIYCHEQHGEKVSNKRVRELRNKIINETRDLLVEHPDQGSLRPGTFKLPQHASP